MRLFGRSRRRAERRKLISVVAAQTPYIWQLERENREALETIDDLGEHEVRAKLSFRMVIADIGALQNRVEELERRAGFRT